MVHKRVLRYDSGTLRSPTVTAQGFLRVDGYVGRPGIYEYVNTAADEEDGLGKKGAIRRELRPDEEVFRDDAMAGFASAPITLLHPKVNVDPKNYRALSVGEVQGSARRDDDKLAAELVIKDHGAIARVQSKKLMQLSPGYRMRIDRSSGVDPKYGKYDVIQRDITINHLALVPMARGGDDMRVRLDGADAGMETRGDGMWFGDATTSVEPGPGTMKLTIAVQGHQHTLYPSQGAAGCTSYAISEGSDTGHEHAWIKNTDGSITLAENQGHTHAVLDTAVAGDRTDARTITSAKTPERAATPPRAEQTRTDAASTSDRRGAPMEEEEQIRSLKAQLAESEKIAVERKDAVDAATARAEKAEAAIITLDGRVTELTTQIEAGSTAAETEAIRLQAQRADAAELQVSQFGQRFDEAVTKRTTIIRKAITVMGDEFNPDQMTNRQIQAVVVKRLDSKADITDALSDASLEGSFDSLVNLRNKSAQSIVRASKVITTGSNAGATANRADSAEERRIAHRNQGSRPLHETRGAAARKGA